MESASGIDDCGRNGRAGRAERNGKAVRAGKAAPNKGFNTRRCAYLEVTVRDDF